MEFLIRRINDSGQKPCDEAQPINEDENSWFIEINSLEELLAFQEKYKEELVIGKTPEWYHQPEFPYSLVIYDDSRE